ncbi:uncharacterized protein V6R79_004083 [Siganus canaliculatus]
MPDVNCSLVPGGMVSSDGGCPEVGVLCGVNLSWVLRNQSGMCLSEEEYLAEKLGPRRSPMFLPVCVTYLIIFLVGVLGNSLTCAVILRFKVMQTPTNYYLLSLAVSDLLVLLLGMPLELYDMWQNYPFLLGEGGCYFKTFLFETVCFASILNVTAVSVERYVAVVHPLKVKHMATRTHVKRVIFMLWAVSMLCAVPNTSLHGIVELPQEFGRRFPQSAICGMVKPKWVYNLIILISTMVFFLFPMLVISVLYLLIGLQLHREKRATMMGGPESLSCTHRQRLGKRNLQVTKMLCVLVVVFGLCWAPFHTERLVWSYIDVSSEHHNKLFEYVHIVSGVFFYLSSAVNPILYNLMSSRFREMFSHCCTHGRPRRSVSQITQRSTLSEKTSKGVTSM